ncbi:MAG TPA: TAT-variant-translocated molybdopterin oxidoreductase [Tepidisphaeraceae bacterium]|nr:TAT-variant-translocated molybdopterin oxidoreductase [Tepidisphaeraceae bacterium]
MMSFSDWRRLEHLVKSGELRRQIEAEFPGYGPQKIVSTPRRGFLKLMGTLLTMGVLQGCQNQREVDQRMPLPVLSGPVIRQPAAQVAPAPTPEVKRLPAQEVASGLPAGWVPSAAPRDWRYIVIHHSATPRGGARSFDQEHRRRGWDGMGYDFVIGNGTDTRDGQIEVGSRWTRQIQGAHAGVALYNEYGIGICLVGDFNIDRPTPSQISSVARLTAYLMSTYHIPTKSVLGHRDCKPTDCPGRYVSVIEIRRLANQRIAAGLARK